MPIAFELEITANVGLTRVGPLGTGPVFHLKSPLRVVGRLWPRLHGPATPPLHKPAVLSVAEGQVSAATALRTALVAVRILFEAKR